MRAFKFHTIVCENDRKQFTESIEWLCGKKLPVNLDGNPDVYTLCKRDENGMAVYIGNFFEDAIDELVVKLGEKYDEVKFINCKGRLSGNKVIIDNIPPYASVGFFVGKG